MKTEKTITPPEPMDATEKKLVQLVDEHQDELINLLKALIGFDTRTFDSQTYSDINPAALFCQKFFENHEIQTQILQCPHENDSSKHWPNLVATLPGTEPGRRLGFMGHLDVVPYTAANWDDGLSPLNAVIKDHKLYGRGAADMKSGVAAQMMAMALFKKANLPFAGELQMIFTPDEEITGNYGAGFLAKQHHEIAQADARIISEPTGQSPIKSPAIIIGEKGANWIQLTFYGASGHGSQPKPKSNAVNKAARFIHFANKKLKFKKVKPPMTRWDLIKGMLSRYSLKNLLFGDNSDQGEEISSYDEDGSGLGNFFNTTVSFNQIQAGKKTNVIPDRCVVEADIRILPRITLQDLLDDLANYCSKLGYRIQIPENFKNRQDQNSKFSKRPVDIEVKVISSSEGGEEPTDSEICQILGTQFEKVFQKKRLYFFSPGMTDATHFRNEGINNIVVFGPSGENAHDANEFIYLDDFIACTKTFLLTAYRYLRR